MNSDVRSRRLDTGTLLGLALALAGIFGAQWIDGGHIESLMQGTALLIVVAGTIGAVLVQTPRDVFARARADGALTRCIRRCSTSIA